MLECSTALSISPLASDSTPEAEAFVKKMETIWGGTGKGVMRNPTARIAEIVEAKEL